MEYGFTSSSSYYSKYIDHGLKVVNKHFGMQNLPVLHISIYHPLLHIKLVPGINEKHFLDAHVNWANLFHLEKSKKTPLAAGIQAKVSPICKIIFVLRETYWRP